ISPSGHVADAQVGEIPGFARQPPPPGWRITSPLVIVSADGGGADAALRPMVLVGGVGTKKSMLPKHRFQINPKT
ncbi:MAG: hypothetical protein PUG32_05200, partial [Bacteroidales bacterium]|nr:hypothetical protein [Bacteroidales bacterium]